MEIKFLGSGSAFVLHKENYHSNIIISKYDDVSKTMKHLLYDAGTTIPDSLDEAGLTPYDLDSIYISHLHADHAGGVEYLAFKTFFECWPFGTRKPKLIGHHRVIIDGWKHTWSGGLKSINGKMNILSDYFDLRVLSDNDSFNFYGLTITPVKTIHVVDSEEEVPSFGLMIEENGVNVFITGDSAYEPEYLNEYYLKADSIFHDGEFAEYPNSVHSQYVDLCRLPKEIKSKTSIYHYMLKGKTYEELNEIVLKDGFKGLVHKGQNFSIETKGE